MGDYQKCPTCKNYDFMRHHRCPPVWLVLCEGDDDWDSDAIEVYARYPDDAAEKAAGVIDDGNGEGPRERVLFVKPAGGGEVKRYEITFDCVVEYSAYEEEAID